MKDIFQHSMSQYTRYSRYTPAQTTTKHYSSTSAHYSPTHYSTSTHYSYTHYSPTHYTSTHYTPTQHIPTKYTPSLHKQSSARLRPVRTVRFPNDIVFQDHVRQGDLEQIGRFLRARKVRLDTIYLSGMAALHEAVLSGNLDCVKLLVTYGADVQQRDEDGWTPLHMACSDGYPHIAKYLLSVGASVDARNEKGEKPADLIDPECKDLVQLFEVGV